MLKRHSDEELSHKSQQDWSCEAGLARETVLFSSLRKMIYPRELPEAESLSDIEIIGLLNEMEFDLMQNQVQVDFLDRLPARVAYQGILQLLDSPIEIDASAFLTKHIDGCDSACESCFQLAHCSVARNVLGKDWRLAVQQAKINPSWSALFSQDEVKEDEN
jgi:hypothetical protein